MVWPYCMYHVWPCQARQKYSCTVQSIGGLWHWWIFFSGSGAYLSVLLRFLCKVSSTLYFWQCFNLTNSFLHVTSHFTTAIFFNMVNFYNFGKMKQFCSMIRCCKNVTNGYLWPFCRFLLCSPWQNKSSVSSNVANTIDFSLHPLLFAYYVLNLSVIDIELCPLFVIQCYQVNMMLGWVDKLSWLSANVVSHDTSWKLPF